MDETFEAGHSTSGANAPAAELSLIVGVVDDSGALRWLLCVFAPRQSRRSSACSGAVNGTAIWTTNQSAIS
jgi:hypothetical protein